MLTGIHFLLTYRCTFECDHCFVFGGPNAQGTFTLAQVRQVLQEARRIGTIDTVYFEGGEPMLFYPLLLASVREARQAGLRVGIVTNGYFATSPEDAALWLAPLGEMSISDLSISDDAFHASDEDNPAKRATAAARALNMPADVICIRKPTVVVQDASGERGQPVVGGNVLFRGRAAERLTSGLPLAPWDSFVECPHEDLEEPKRVHVDCYGNVQLCQGITMGNLWQTPLHEMVSQYHAAAHPIAGPLARGGPALLAKEYDAPHDAGYVDACHMCYTIRKALIGRWSQYLNPPQVYGL